MKKNLFIALLFSFFLGACGGESAKCDNKVALEILESLIKDNILGLYNLNHSNEKEFLNRFNPYITKDVKIQFSNFRTQAKTEYSCRCVATITLTFPYPSAEIREFLSKRNARDLGIGTGGIITSLSNDTHELDNVYYDITLTDDKKQVYAGFLNLKLPFVKYAQNRKLTDINDKIIKALR